MFWFAVEKKTGTSLTLLFRSFVEYGIFAWGRNKSPEIKKNSLLQKRAVRIIDNARTVSHTDPLFLKYKILELNDLTEFIQATFMYKYTKHFLPSLI